MTTARPVLQLGLCGQFANNDGSSWDPMHEVVINRLQQTLNQFQQRPSLPKDVRDTSNHCSSSSGWRITGMRL
jgi:hypothetical protein